DQDELVEHQGKTYRSKGAKAETGPPPGPGWDGWTVTARPAALIGDRLARARAELERAGAGPTGAGPDSEATTALCRTSLALVKSLQRENMSLVRGLRGVTVEKARGLVREQAATLVKDARFLKDLKAKAKTIAKESAAVVKLQDTIAAMAGNLDG